MASMKSRFIEEIPPEFLDVENLIPSADLEPGGLGYEAPARNWRSPEVRPASRSARSVSRIGAAEGAGRRERELQRAMLTQTIQAGSVVFHPQFGEGEVMTVRGAGDSTTCEIAFRSGFSKTLMVRFAPLQILRQ
jgi:hypothetical protein